MRKGNFLWTKLRLKIDELAAKKGTSEGEALLAKSALVKPHDACAMRVLPWRIHDERLLTCGEKRAAHSACTAGAQWCRS